MYIIRVHPPHAGIWYPQHPGSGSSGAVAYPLPDLWLEQAHADNLSHLGCRQRHRESSEDNLLARDCLTNTHNAMLTLSIFPLSVLYTLYVYCIIIIHVSRV